jgi:hypothetical protein
LRTSSGDGHLMTAPPSSGETSAGFARKASGVLHRSVSAVASAPSPWVRTWRPAAFVGARPPASIADSRTAAVPLARPRGMRPRPARHPVRTPRPDTRLRSRRMRLRYPIFQLPGGRRRCRGGGTPSARLSSPLVSTTDRGNHPRCTAGCAARRWRGGARAHGELARAGGLLDDDEAV